MATPSIVYQKIYIDASDATFALRLLLLFNHSNTVENAFMSLKCLQTKTEKEETGINSNARIHSEMAELK